MAAAKRGGLLPLLLSPALPWPFHLVLVLTCDSWLSKSTKVQPLPYLPSQRRKREGGGEKNPLQETTEDCASPKPTADGRVSQVASLQGLSARVGVRGTPVRSRTEYFSRYLDGI